MLELVVGELSFICNVLNLSYVMWLCFYDGCCLSFSRLCVFLSYAFTNICLTLVHNPRICVFGMISSLYSNCVQNEHIRLIKICDMCTQIGGAHSHTYSKVSARLFYLISFQSVLSSITKKGEIVSAINLR